MLKNTFLLSILGLVFSCTGTQKTTTSNINDLLSETTIESGSDDVITEEVNLGELEVLANRDKGPYRASKTRYFDLLHTSLDVRFDWDKQHLIGQATLDLTPYFYESDLLILDAKGFEIKEVALVKNGQKRAVEFEYKENAYIHVPLDKVYKKGEEFTVFIDYVSKPNDLEVAGGIAITDERGLYFINPLGEDESTPMQIWTQGETEFNSCWFPTIDAPNEKSSQEIFMTVADKFTTLSNGVLMGTKNNGNGTHTDHWKQEKIHAPYLFMMAVGEFEVIQDNWNGMPVNYYVEKEYAPYAQKVFGNTPEMLTFYSDLLEYPYPWDKYSQIVVREFVSGAMENTSAVVFFDGMNRDFRELLDEDHEDIIAHELFHHWFGDIVTCESWSNLPLNESFATYGEYLWIEYKYGKDAADHHLMMDLRNHLAASQQAEGKRHMIRYFYDDKEDMFDSHSYQKGGRILHMLRNYVGDDAFFASLTKYLKDNEFQAVEMDNLRLAFEEVTGEDLNWFFNQWFFGVGHPVLDITYGYENGVASVTVEQLQEEEPFTLPVAIDLYFQDAEVVGRPVEKSVQREKVMLTDRKQTFTFKVKEEPRLINFDADKMLLCEKQENKTVEQYAYQYTNAPHFLDRYEVPMNIEEKQDSPAGQEAILAALKDEFWSVRGRAIMHLDIKNEALVKEAVPILEKLIIDDEESTVRSLAVEKLSELGDAKYEATITKAIKDSSYRVVGAGLSALSAVNPEAALKAGKTLEGETNEEVVAGLSEVYGQNGGAEQLAFFTNNINKVKDYGRYVMAEQYGILLGKVGKTDDIKKGISQLSKVALDDPNWWVRLNGTMGLLEIQNALTERGLETDQGLLDSILDQLRTIKSEESNTQLKGIYGMQLNFD